MVEVNLAENNSSALVGTAISFLAFTYVSVGLRTYVRAGLTRNFMLDDWLMLISQAIFTTSCAFILLGVKSGLGHHNKALAQPDEIESLKWQALATASYILNMMFIKLSYAIFLLRLAVQKRYRWTLWGSMFVVAVWSTVLFFWDIFQCKPVRAQWDYTIPGEVCVSSEQIVAAAYALSVMTIVTDWMYALMPIPMIWNVKMTKQAKVIVVVLLGLGVFASVATLIRLKFLSDLNDTDDILFAGTDAMVWTLIEPGVAIVASSLVTIRPLLHAMRIKGFMSTENSTALRYGHNNNQPRSAGAGPRAYARGSMPGFGRGDIRLADMETAGGPERPGVGGADPLPSKAGTFASNGSDSSLAMPVAAVKGAVYSAREVSVDEVPLRKERR
ncbi:hypothetical protein GE09DRAFT_967965 [Coniochaeta sp. 2T2.1]|nr:hypothetical protein GE09DRAFT_967965 [Coniochaeta sp. 2T2.1]